ncbi:MAG: VTT domain-containing protein [Paracoccaceae bacterium]|nr:VTT domain-containing protein [Paracoccaceae bacterium]
MKLTTRAERDLRSAPGLNAKTMAVLSAAAALAYIAVQTGTFDQLSRVSNPDDLAAFIEHVGPFAVVLLLALAVVVSPIPSGPIAMAAGALYGPAEGGALTAVGALVGALIAFGLSRGLGYRPLSASKLPLAHWITRPRTQTRLALAILVSRLIPFISFDAVSYVAGLTTIRMRNFAIATTLGVLPASFAFAALGAGMTKMDNVLLLIAACGVTLILPIGWVLFRRLGRWRSRS